jgi:hypothetical protein
MRAGKYAVVGGAAYEASFSRGSDGVMLVVPSRDDRPDGFEWDERYGWTRDVGWADVERIYEVETWARDAVGYALRVYMPPRNGRVQVVQPPGGGPYDDVPDGHPAYLVHNTYDREWQGTLPVDELRDAREIEHERDLAAYAEGRPDSPRS